MKWQLHKLDRHLQGEASVLFFNLHKQDKMWKELYLTQPTVHSYRRTSMVFCRVNRNDLFHHHCSVTSEVILYDRCKLLRVLESCNSCDNITNEWLRRFNILRKRYLYSDQIANNYKTRMPVSRRPTSHLPIESQTLTILRWNDLNLEMTLT